MRILLDTHIWLWLNASPGKLRKESLALLRNPENLVYLSAASAWEIAIKYQTGKLDLPVPPSEFIPSRMVKTRVFPLEIRHAHSWAAASLPLHHKDPFDRMLIAQAQIEDLPLMTRDEKIAEYQVEILKV